MSPALTSPKTPVRYKSTSVGECRVGRAAVHGLPRIDCGNGSSLNALLPRRRSGQVTVHRHGVRGRLAPGESLPAYRRRGRESIPERARRLRPRSVLSTSEHSSQFVARNIFARSSNNSGITTMAKTAPGQRIHGFRKCQPRNDGRQNAPLRRMNRTTPASLDCRHHMPCISLGKSVAGRILIRHSLVGQVFALGPNITNPACAAWRFFS